MKCKSSLGKTQCIFVLLLMTLAILVGCAGVGSKFESKSSICFTPVTMEPTNTYHPGKIVWHDLVTPDPAAARKFYGELFGWTFRDSRNYTEIFHDGKKIGGIVRIKDWEGKKSPASWLPSISVPDVDRAVEYVRSKGGQVIRGPVDMPMRGRGALIRDPEGAYLVLLHALGGDPPDGRAKPGEWLWNELWTTYLETSTWFYKKLGSYETVVRGPDYVVLVNEGRWRVGLREIKQKIYSGRWVPVVRVKNPALLVSRVQKLGGIVLLKPGEGSASTDTALIADNTGALLILQRWTYPERKEPRS